MTLPTMDPGRFKETALHMLSKRERECLVLVCDALQDKEIAYRLDISLSTTKHYLATARRKMGAKNRVHLVLMAIGRDPSVPDKAET